MSSELNPSERLKSIQLKFDWAARQSAELEAAIDAFLETANYTLNLDAGYPFSTLSFAEITPTPTDIRLLFADHVHNLRSVLDQLMWHIVAMHTGHEPASVVAFPVVINKKRWDEALKKQLRGFPPQWLHVIEWAQPFEVQPPSEHPAYYLHHLDIAGKHHQVVGFGLTLVQIPDPELITNRPMGPLDRIQVEQSGGPFELVVGEVLRRYFPISPHDDLRITGVGRIDQAQIVLGPYRDDVKFPGGIAPMKNRNYVNYVGSVLEALKPAFN